MKKEIIKKKSLIKPIIITAAVSAMVIATGFTMASKVYAAPDYSKYINYEVSQQDLKNAKEARDKARRQAQKASNKVNKLKKEKKNLKGELKNLNQLSDEQRAQYEIIAGQLEAALIAKTEALDLYIEAQENLSNQQELFSDRISVMFEYQNKSTLEVLLESDSIAGFFTNMEIITLIADADKQTIEQMQIALDDAQLQADIALKEAEDMQGIADEKQKQLDELEARIGVTTEALEDVSTELSSWESQEDALEQYANSLDAQVKQLQKQYNSEHPTNTPVPKETTTKPTTTTTATSSTTKPEPGETSAQATATPKPTNTPKPTATPKPDIQETPPAKPGSAAHSFSIWPVTCRNITSYYGYRVHPVYGTVKFHSGIDISGSGATYGSTIVAPASGTVIKVNYPYPNQNKGGSDYGNYIMIDHGNGIVTLYGHCKSITVKSGQHVSQGEKIGTVGSTGTSTGAHLHFEVRKNGDRVDPLAYLP